MCDVQKEPTPTAASRERSHLGASQSSFGLPAAWVARAKVLLAGGLMPHVHRGSAIGLSAEGRRRSAALVVVHHRGLAASSHAKLGGQPLYDRPRRSGTLRDVQSG